MNEFRWVLIVMMIISITWGCAPQQEGYSIENLQQTAQKSVLETSIAIPTETAPPVPTLRLTNTPDSNITNTPTASQTPTLTSTSTQPPPPSPTSLPQVFVAGDTNCRTGPSNHYDWKTLVRSGQSVVVVGQSTNNYYWVIENPNGSGTCWLWKAYTTLVSPVDRLPIFASPPTKTPTRTPTPTPTPGARFQFSQVTQCNNQDVLVIMVFNSSRRTLQDWRARLFNLPGKILQIEYQAEQFSHDINECRLTINSLSFREIAYMVVPFDPSAASDFYVEVEACSYTGPERDCSYDTIEFNVAYITATPTYTPTPTDTPTPTITLTPTETP